MRPGSMEKSYEYSGSLDKGTAFQVHSPHLRFGTGYRDLKSVYRQIPPAATLA